MKCYDARDKTWHYVASMNAARSKLSMAEVNGFIYAMGGFDGSTTLNTVESYSIGNEQVSQACRHLRGPCENYSTSFHEHGQNS